MLALAGGTLPGCGGGGGSVDDGTFFPDPLPPGVPVDGPAWRGFGGDAQHAANSRIATQDLNRIVWSTPLDQQPQYQPDGSLLAHYGSPVVTSHNTVVLPVKTSAGGSFRVEARYGSNGALLWRVDSDYRLPPHRWVPSYNLALTTANRLYAPASGGRLLVKDDADAATSATRFVAFYGGATYSADAANYDATVFINTPLTVDAAGNVYFGFVVTGSNAAALQSGFARVAPDGSGRWVSATAASGDPSITKPAMNSAPALSLDGTVLYVAVNNAGERGALLALDSTTLARRSRVTLLDPGSGSAARVSDDSTASPTVGPDGDVYFGVLEAAFGTHNGRGWLLHFDAALTTTFTPGGFGWDDTASVVPAALVGGYTGSSNYLLMVKYNNYAGIGTGTGANRLAVLDPRAGQTDAISGLPIMREVITILGPTFESGTSGPVKEWCINTAAVDPYTRSVLVNSEDGVLYRWSLATNTLSQRIRLSNGLGESYTPTAIGADGAVYAVSNALVCAVGR